MSASTWLRAAGVEQTAVAGLGCQAARRLLRQTSSAVTLYARPNVMRWSRILAAPALTCRLAQHPAANFGVQAALAALRKPQQVGRVF